jgi:hypothetical protein
MRALDIIAGIALVVTVIALPFLIYNWSSYVARRRISFPSLRSEIPMPMKSLLFFAVSVLIGLGASQTSQKVARGQVMDQLESLKGDYHVSIYGKEVGSGTDIGDP